MKFKEFYENNGDIFANFISYPLQTFRQWSGGIDISDKVNEVFSNDISYRLQRWDNYELLFDDEQHTLNIINSIMQKYYMDFNKLIQAYDFLLKDANYKVENIEGTVNKLSKNEGFSSFEASSVDETNNWNNMVMKTNTAGVSDLYAQHEFYKNDLLEKMCNDIAFNILQMIY